MTNLIKKCAIFALVGAIIFIVMMLAVLAANKLTAKETSLGFTTKSGLDIDGDATFADDVTVTGNLAITGTTGLTGAVSLSGALATERLTTGANMLATSTATAYATTTQADLTTYSGYDFTPGDLAVSFVLPATSTLTTFIPNTGDCADWRLRNLDATAATSTTIVAGTGIDLVENENGDVVIEGGNEARLRFCRELDTDVTVYVDEYIAAD